MPQGLLSGYKLQKTHLGAYVFDIEYREEKGKTVINIKNYNEEAIKVIFEVRKYGAGAQGECRKVEELVLQELLLRKSLLQRQWLCRKRILQELSAAQ